MKISLYIRSFVLVCLNFARKSGCVTVCDCFEIKHRSLRRCYENVSLVIYKKKIRLKSVHIHPFEKLRDFYQEKIATRQAARRRKIELNIKNKFESKTEIKELPVHNTGILKMYNLFEHIERII